MKASTRRRCIAVARILETWAVAIRKRCKDATPKRPRKPKPVQP
jgi:hypothetical protein